MCTLLTGVLEPETSAPRMNTPSGAEPDDEAESEVEPRPRRLAPEGQDPPQDPPPFLGIILLIIYTFCGQIYLIIYCHNQEIENK